MHMRKMKLRDKIMYYSIITMLVVHLSFIFYSQKTIERVTIDEAEISTQKNVDIIRNSMEFMFTNVKSKVAEISIETELIHNIHDYYENDLNMATLKRNLTEVINLNIGISNIITGVDIVFNDGQIIHTSPIRDDAVDAILVSETFEDLSYEPYVWNGPVLLKHYNGIEEYYFIIRKKIVDVDTSEQLGILYVYISESDFRALYESVFDTETNQFIITNHEGIIVSAANRTTIGSSIYTHVDMGGEKLNLNKGLKIRNDNDEFILTSFVGDEQFQMISIKKIVELERASKEIGVFLMWFTVLYVVLIFVVNSVISKQLTTSLRDLVSVMSRIKQGERSLRADLSGSDEFQLLGASFNDLMDNNEQLLEDVYKTHEQIRIHELRVLNEQIKPHFLYNTLGSVSSLIKLKMYNEAIDAVQNLAAFFRVFLNEGHEIYTLSSEIKMIESYLTIQRYRYSHLLGFTIDIDSELLDYAIPKLLLQPLIENAIYHGVKSRAEKTKIEVSSKIHQDEILLIVKDYGKGIDPERLAELNENIHKRYHRENFGLRSVNQRIQLRYGNDYGVEIESTQDIGTRVCIKLPLNQLEEKDDESRNRR